jgi:molybdopterin-guanine dinucleotide biosynthesis protein A
VIPRCGTEAAPGDVLGVILAGGRSSRMGGLDKGGLMLADRPMISHVVARFAPQVGRLVLNAAPDSYPSIDLPHVPDPIAGQPGPLTGLLAAMRWAEVHASDTRWIATVPVDAPFLPADLVARLMGALRQAPDADIAYAASPNGPQPVFVLADRALAGRLEQDLMAGTASRVGNWIRRQKCVAVAFGEDSAFANINTPADLVEAAAQVAPNSE